MRALPPLVPGVALALVLAVLACTPSSRTPPSLPQPPTAIHWQSRLDVDHPLAGVIWDVSAGRRVDEADLVARVRAADLVLVGETHDNPDHHQLEAALIRAFAGTHDAPAVVFEMLDREKQETIDASLRSRPGDADALAQATDWAKSGWPEWSMYRPVFEAALTAHSPLLAAGLDRAMAMRIAHDGVDALDPALVQTFGLAGALPADVQASLRREMSEVHCGLLPEAMLDSMVLVQRARDALLAARLHEGAARGHGAVLVAGAGHVRRDRGVPAQVRSAYGASSLAIGLVQVTAQGTTPESYAASFGGPALPFDFVWFTPRVNDTDHCAELRAHVAAHAVDGGL
jgi:uncharacterized iron-regulated protein